MSDFPKRLGIIAGGGDVPNHLIQSCQKLGIKVFIVALDGQTDVNTVQNMPHIWSRPGAAGSILKYFKSEDIRDLVLIGTLRRPSFAEMKPDLKTAEFFATYALKTTGDDDLLKALRRFLEKEGFSIYGAHKFMPDLLCPKGNVTLIKPNKAQQDDIARGVEILETTGALDIGQAVVIQNGHVLGLEAAEGTDALIDRCASLQRKGTGAVLVKLCKPNQDFDLDLPTIGLQTIENVVQAGFSGIAAHADRSFLLDLQGMKALAKKNKVFVYGVVT